jgi:phage terminase small subunit|tara:strand:+ start:4014 stop:4595 length:582 start_codon:yes stop_codon:yes gene_type:complete
MIHQVYQGVKKNMSTIKKINPEDRRLKQKLTPKQMLFVTNYVQGTLTGKMSASEAARKAGYSETRARQTAHELLNPKINPFIVEAITEMKQDLYETSGVSMASHLTALKEMRDEARENNHYSAAINAEVARGRVAGFYELKNKAEDAMEQMSTAELVEILEKYDEQGITHERGLIVEEDRMSLTNDTRTAKGD